MKKFLLACSLLLFTLSSFAITPIPGDSLLYYVRTKLPTDPITLSGTLKVRTKKGFTKTSEPVEMHLNWKRDANASSADYKIGKETLQIKWANNTPIYTFSEADRSPTSDIKESGLTWADLSFSFLWWPNSVLVDEGKKINRECYILDVPVPNSKQTMRLWIEKSMGMILEAQTLDKNRKKVRRLKIKSIKKIDGIWLAKDMEIKDYVTGMTTTLQITDLKWDKPKKATPVATAAAFNPATAINQLAVDLYKELASESKENLFLSPYSISTALAMTYAGARTETEAQMEKTLSFGSQEATHPGFAYLQKKIKLCTQDDGLQLLIANALWPQKGDTFNSTFLSTTQSKYGSEVTPLDYKTQPEAARVTINTWVEDKTKALIKNLIPEGFVDKLTRLILVNAIYFKGDWAAPFSVEATKPQPFTQLGVSTNQVPMMSQSDSFNMATTNGFQALELPYQDNLFSMIILLPTKMDGLAELEKSLTAQTIADLDFHAQTVQVYLPKFNMESSFMLSETLSDLGMPIAFSEQADFSGMNGKRDLFIGEVIHKAAIEVNEAGTEAAAATAVVMQRMSMPAQFIANHPFLFAIRDNGTGALLFIGRITNPVK